MEGTGRPHAVDGRDGVQARSRLERVLNGFATASACTAGLSIPQAAREFEFSDADFRALAKIAYEHAGIMLPEAKKNLVYGRLSRRLRTLGMNSFEDYRKYLVENRRAGTRTFHQCAVNKPYKILSRRASFRSFHIGSGGAVRGRAPLRWTAAHMVGGLFDRRGAAHHRVGAPRRIEEYRQPRRPHSCH